MSKVLEFPVSERKAVTILQHLESGAEELEELYEVLDEIHRQLHEAEERATVLEAQYNTSMREYLKHVDIKDVPLILMQYSSEARISMDGEEGVISFTMADKEDEINED